MREKINNKIYNTDTSKFISSYMCGGWNKFFRFDIYQKKNKEYFLYFEGGLRARYVGKVKVKGVNQTRDILTMEQSKEFLSNEDFNKIIELIRVYEA